MSFVYGYENDGERNGTIFSDRIHGLQSNKALVITWQISVINSRYSVLYILYSSIINVNFLSNVGSL